MNSLPSFPDQIAVLENKRKQKTRLVFFVRFLSFFLMIEALIFFGETGPFFFPYRHFLHSLSTLAAFSWALWFHRRGKKDLLSELRALDRRFDLGDRLSTAYEYLRPEKRSLFKDPLMEDAALSLAGLPRKTVLPFPFSLLDLAIPAVSAFLLLLHLYWPLSLDLKGKPHPAPTLWEKRVTDFSQKKDPLHLRAEVEGPFSVEPYAELIESALKGKDPSLGRERLLQVMKKMKAELREERSRLGRDLVRGLPEGQGSGPWSSPESPRELKQFTEALKKLFGNNLPDSLARDLEQLLEAFAWESFLDQAMDFILSPRQGGELDSLLAFLKSKRVSQGSADGKSNGSSSESFPSHSRREGREADKEIPSKAGGQQGGLKPDQEDGSHRGGEGPFFAGSQRGGGERLNPSEIPRAKGPVSREGGIPFETAPRPAFSVRTKPLLRKDETPREQVIGQGRIFPAKGREAVIRQEKIPREYREVVKNYFLSVKEEKGIKVHEQSR